MKAGYFTPPLPLPSDSKADTAPTLVVETSKTRLHTHPAELYLGAASSRGRLNMYIFYDGNVFEREGVVGRSEGRGVVVPRSTASLTSGSAGSRWWSWWHWT
ncbi:hypothetical protein V8E55_003368 [Tylopilus felleus]